MPARCTTASTPCMASVRTRRSVTDPTIVSSPSWRSVGATTSMSRRLTPSARSRGRTMVPIRPAAPVIKTSIRHSLSVECDALVADDYVQRPPGHPTRATIKPAAVVAVAVVVPAVAVAVAVAVRTAR